uniref:Uncharacterized protein n=1 Tax=Arcella intermedia TaxID=1963864 RepID=A0A6B2L1E9_9EUKA
MVAFLSYHYPHLVDPQFRPKFKALPPPLSGPGKGPAGSGALVDHSDLPNVPLYLTHSYVSALGNYTPAMASRGYHLFHGHHTPATCTEALEYLRPAAYEMVTGPKAKHSVLKVKISSDAVHLESEFFSGKSTSREEEDIIEFYRHSADSGNTESQVAMGVLLALGGIGGLEKDYQKAVEYFAMAGEEDDANGLAHLGWMYQHGLGVPNDNETAFALYEQAALLGSTFGMNALGECYYYGTGTETDLTSAKTWFEVAAEKNDPEAQLNLGRMAFSGIGTTKSYSKARSYFHQSALGGNLVALYNLAIMNSYGFGVKISCQQAASYFNKIIEKTISKENLIQAYQYYTMGYYDRALIHYEIAADQGDHLGQLNAAWMYEMDLGIHEINKNAGYVERNRTRYNLKKAFMYYMQAAEQGSPEAHVKIGDYYYYQKAPGATGTDSARAAAFYRAASTLRDPQATFNLGYMHHNGIGVPRDRHLAKRYYDMSLVQDPEGYLAVTLALNLLWVELYWEQIQMRGLLWGMSTDNTLIAVLVVILFVSIIVRWILERRG